MSTPYIRAYAETDKRDISDDFSGQIGQNGHNGLTISRMWCTVASDGTPHAVQTGRKGTKMDITGKTIGTCTFWICRDISCGLNPFGDNYGDITAYNACGCNCHKPIRMDIDLDIPYEIDTNDDEWVATQSERCILGHDAQTCADAVTTTYRRNRNGR